MIDTDNKFQVMTSGLLTADKIKAKYLNILDSSIPKPTQAPLPTATPTQAPTATPTQAPLPTEAPTVTPTVAPSGKVTEKFTDVSPDKWYAKEGGTQPIQYVIDNGIMKGTGDGTTFAPEEDCSREMMVQILYNTATDQSYSINNPFNDVQNKWYKNAVLWAYEKKITTGKGDGIFGIGNGVTRQEMAKFLLSYATYRGYETYVRADISSYADASSVAGWALDAMRWANAAGIINGKTENGQAVLAPTKGASRAEVAQMIMNFQKKFGK